MSYSDKELLDALEIIDKRRSGVIENDLLLHLKEKGYIEIFSNEEFMMLNNKIAAGLAIKSKYLEMVDRTRKINGIIAELKDILSNHSLCDESKKYFYDEWIEMTKNYLDAAMLSREILADVLARSQKVIDISTAASSIVRQTRHVNDKFHAKLTKEGVNWLGRERKIVIRQEMYNY